MSKFKVGDRVRRVVESEWPCKFGQVGCEYEVLKVEPSGSIVVVEGHPGASPWGFEAVGDKEVASCGPIRTVTRREIVPGVYGARGEVAVGKAGTCTMVQIKIDAPMSKNHLREAARIFNEIADALEENANG